MWLRIAMIDKAKTTAACRKPTAPDRGVLSKE